MPGKRKFEEQLAALDALRQQPPELAIEPLRKALAQRNNFLVAKAADRVRELSLSQLTPELLTAFDRFFEDPVKSDPQCWAKIAIARALAAFEHQDADVFLRGMKHIQPEPSYGGASDSGGALRATCAFAMVQCRRLTDSDLLAHLIELLADKDKSVRAEVCRAIEQVGSPSAGLLLRLRAVLGSDEPEVLGACYSGVLRIEGVSAIAWVSRFLEPGDDAAGEAAPVRNRARPVVGCCVALCDRTYAAGGSDRIAARSGSDGIATQRACGRSHLPIGTARGSDKAIGGIGGTKSAAVPLLGQPSIECLMQLFGLRRRPATAMLRLILVIQSSGANKRVP